MLRAPCNRPAPRGWRPVPRRVAREVEPYRPLGRRHDPHGPARAEARGGLPGCAAAGALCVIAASAGRDRYERRHRPPAEHDPVLAAGVARAVR